MPPTSYSHLSRVLGTLAKGKGRAGPRQQVQTLLGLRAAEAFLSSRSFSSSPGWLDQRQPPPQPQPQASAARRPDAPGTTFVEPEPVDHGQAAPSPTARQTTSLDDLADPTLPTTHGSRRPDKDADDDGRSSSDGSLRHAPRAFGQPVVVANPRQLYKGPVERADQQVPLSLPPEHPFHFLPMRDKLRLDKHRGANKLPSFPEPVKMPAFPQPIFKPSDPTTTDADARPTLRYRDLPPDNLVELYRERIEARPQAHRPNTFQQRFQEALMADMDDPKGWWLVREKMGLPPVGASKPASLLWYWEGLTEAQLWKLVMPLFYVWALFPVVGAASLGAYMVYGGYFIDPYDGSWQWTGRNWDRNWNLKWENFTLKRDLTKFDRPPEVRV